MTDNFDTSSLLDDSDIQFMENLNKIKRHMMSFFKPEAIVEQLKSIINGSDSLSFSNKRSEKFISLERPVFNISFDREKCQEKYPAQAFTKEVQEIEWLSGIIHAEIILPFSNFVSAVINKDESVMGRLHEILEGYDQDEIESVSQFVVSNVFGMRIDREKYAANVEFMF